MLLFPLVAISVCLAALAFPVWLLIRVRRVAPLMSEVAALDVRVDHLADSLALLRRDLQALRDSSTQPSEAPAPHAAPQAAPAARVVTEPVAPSTPVARTPQVRHTMPTVVTPARVAPPVTEPRVETPHEWVKRPSTSAPAHATAAASVPARTPQHTSAELEETLGTNWLNKLGAGLLVLGIAFFLSYQLRQLGPLGKDLLGLALGGVLLAGGVFAERRTAYQMFSRGLMAGGWGLLFFTSFAMHYVDAARVIESEPVGLALMLSVAAGMVAHALRYRSQVVTGLALLFAFGTVTISHDAAFTLTACTVLALTSAAISLRMKWLPLELGAIAATYANHFLWLPQLSASPASAVSTLFPASLALLACCWLIFRSSFVLRRELSEEQEGWATLGAALNTCGLVVVASRYPIGTTWVAAALLAFGAADALVARLVRTRRVAYTALVVMASALVAASVPVVAGARLVGFAWFIEAEALVWLGMRTRDNLFTRVGIAGTALAGVQMFALNVAPLVRPVQWHGPLSAPVVSALLLVGAAVFYANSLVMRRRFATAFRAPEDWVAEQLSFAGALSLLAFVWTVTPTPWVAPVWSILGLALVRASGRVGSNALHIQGHALAALATPRILAVNLLLIDRTRLDVLGALPVLVVVALHHLLSRRSVAPSGRADAEVATAHSWTGTALAGLVAWYLFAPLAVALVWVIGAVLLLELGIARDRRDLRLQALAATAAAFSRVWIVNLNGTSGLTGSALVSTLPVAALTYYLYERLSSDVARQERAWVPEVLAVFGTTALGGALRVALLPAYVAPAWGAAVFALALVATLTGRRLFARHGAVGAIVVGVQAVAVNLYGASYFTTLWTSKALTVGVAMAAPLCALPLARRQRAENATSASAFDIWRRPDRPFFFVPLVVVAWMLAITLDGSLITLAWGLEAVVAFLVALWLRERSFRLSALALLLAAVVRIVTLDVWRLDQQGRYLAFIGLGAVLLLVSYLYSRYRARLKEFL